MTVSPIALKTISRTELARKTRAVMSSVQEGRPTLVRSYGQDQVVLLDALDYGLLCGVSVWVLSRFEERTDEEQPVASRVVLDYLDEQISLGRAAEILEISRFELMERFERLSIPLRIGSLDPAEAKDEVRAARRAGG